MIILETVALVPASFWVVIIALVISGMWAAERIRSGIGLPMLAVLGTVAAWYVGDAFYNDYPSATLTFAPKTLEDAWWQVALFLTCFALITPRMHELINNRFLRNTSSVYKLFRNGIGGDAFQQRLALLCRHCFFIWILLVVIAAIRLGNEIPNYFFPFLDYKADPWGRGRLGSGLDSLLSLAGYLQLFVAATFGVIAGLAVSPRIRWAAISACAIMWPFYIFDRTRNTMLSAMLPGVLAWVLLRLRGGWLKKGLIVASLLSATSAWFSFVIANRSSMSITSAVQQKGFSFGSDSTGHHDGLNMFEELCWINALMSDGSYQPEWGAPYLADLVNPIPRSLWPDKPMIGIDYAVARGQSNGEGEAGVGATVSTGMIGQGVINFGRYIGPFFAALLMSCWVAILARLDLQGRDITLYGLGLTLTFNLGRDITFLTIYTFAFGALTIWCLKHFDVGAKVTITSKPQTLTL